MSIEIRVESIIDIAADVIVMSANPSLLAGSGVSGALHKKAGPELEIAAKSSGPIKPGESVITPAFDLNSKYVVHTVCPRFFRGTDEEIALLASAYKTALDSFDQLEDVNSIAFVSMGTGIYRWPIELAANIAIKELKKSRYEKTIMCIVDSKIKAMYESKLTPFFLVSS